MLERCGACDDDRAREVAMLEDVVAIDVEFGNKDIDPDMVLAEGETGGSTETICPWMWR